MPAFDFPHIYTGHHNTTPEEVASRIADATIVVVAVVVVTPSDLAAAPHLQCLAIMATGMGWVDRDAFAKRRVTVINCPQSNIPAVSEHWLGLYFAARKKVVELHYLMTESDEWVRQGTLTKRWEPQGPPLSCAQEVLGIVGFGALGKRIELLARAVGFGEVLVAERKGYVRGKREGRAGFEEVIERCSVLVLCCPRDPETIDLIGEPELKAMRKDACLINMARGGVVNEAALAKALKERWIACAATDVLETEPAALGSSPLLPRLDLGEDPVPNLTVSPHVAWYSVMTIQTLQRLLKEGVEGFVKGILPELNVAVLDGKVYK